MNESGQKASHQGDDLPVRIRDSIEGLMNLLGHGAYGALLTRIFAVHMSLESLIDDICVTVLSSAEPPQRELFTSLLLPKMHFEDKMKVLRHYLRWVHVQEPNAVNICDTVRIVNSLRNSLAHSLPSIVEDQLSLRGRYKGTTRARTYTVDELVMMIERGNQAITSLSEIGVESGQ